MARFRLIVEYDLDVEGNESKAKLQELCLAEYEDWREGNVTLHDVMGSGAICNARAKFELVE